MKIRTNPIIAIDGPAGSGKSTVAALAARKAGLQFISSGSMYRAVALQALRGGVMLANREAIIALAAALDISFTTEIDGTIRTFIGAEDVTEALRAPAVGQISSVIAAIAEVREHLVDKQREYGTDGGIVMEGRDIQTVVFPDADVKIFLDASVAERARRRWKELRAKNVAVSYAEVEQEVKTRDQQDCERDASPMRAAGDAVILDTDGRTIDQVVDDIVQLIRDSKSMLAENRKKRD